MIEKFIKVKVKAKSKKNSIKKLKDDEFFVETKEPPSDNRANNSVMDILAEELKISRNRMILIKGHISPSKIFKIR
jgi:uncharacterized protein YggU (UPF0235/DUF167 family)